MGQPSQRLQVLHLVGQDLRTTPVMLEVMEGVAVEQFCKLNLLLGSLHYRSIISHQVRKTACSAQFGILHHNFRRSLQLAHPQGHNRQLSQLVLQAVAAHLLPLQLQEPFLHLCPSLQQLLLAHLGQLRQRLHFKIDVVFREDGQGAVDSPFANALGQAFVGQLGIILIDALP